MNSCEWNVYTVNELIEIGMIDKPLDGNHGAIHPKSKDYVDFGVPFIMANDLKNGKIDYSTCKYISENQAKILKKGFAKPGDVLLTHKATMGRTAIVGNNFPYVVLTPQVTYYRVLKGISNKYLKYYFDSSKFQAILKSWSGSGSTRSYLGIIGQLKLPVRLPELQEQKAIADTLSCLDDKIELNNRISKKLEKMAQAIFKSWFVDFEPFQGGEFDDSELGRIPKGWIVESLDSIADFLNGLAMQKYRPETDGFLPVIKIKELNQGFTDDSSDKASVDIQEQYMIKNGDVIFSWSGTLMVKIWTGGIGGLNQHLFKVTSKYYDKWFYYLWTLRHLEQFKAIAQDKATTMGHIKRSHLAEAKVIVPKDSDIEMMDSIMEPIFEQLIKAKTQNETLKNIRDTLLPKLMSGEIRVPLEEAAANEC